MVHYHNSLWTLTPLYDTPSPPAQWFLSWSIHTRAPRAQQENNVEEPKLKITLIKITTRKEKNMGTILSDCRLDYFPYRSFSGNVHPSYLRSTVSHSLVVPHGTPYEFSFQRYKHYLNYIVDFSHH